MITVEKVREVFDGRVVGPDDAEYDQARALFYGGMDRRPFAIVRPESDDEVARAVRLAAENDLELSVRSGGHSIPGHSVCDGGIVIDLSRMRALEIDPVQRTAWAETGLTAIEYTKAAAEHGLATGFGDTGSVGIGGITLGGGVGYLARKHGLTIDNLLAADIVTADGERRRIDADNHPDLFWAIRGGGGNFGVATRFCYRLAEVETVLGGMLILPATADVIGSFIEAASAAPEELTTIANILPAPPMPFLPEEQHGQLIMFALVCYAGDPAEGEQVVAPLRALATPLADMLRPMPYPEVYPPDEEGYHPIATSRNLFVEGIDAAAGQTIVDHLNESDAMMRVTQLRVLGGAVSRVPADATAYAHRAQPIMVNVAALCQSVEEAAARTEWVRGLASALNPADTGAYVGFIGDEGPERVRSAYPPATWERLAKVKAAYDPANLFRHNHNIAPAG